MICKIGKSLAEIENFLKEKYIQEMVLYAINAIRSVRSPCLTMLTLSENVESS